MLVVSDI